ncbi:MAG: hypothetical protein MI785_20130 [Kiloniellales bacterium]|nr:hypothetical protein [Kiloniellales bacterium]
MALSDDRTALVRGASSGIGRATARALEIVPNEQSYGGLHMAPAGRD